MDSRTYLMNQSGALTQTTDNPITPTVATSATQVLRGNPNRYSLIITNLSANDGYVWRDSSVGATYGIKIPANGGTLILNLKDDGMIVTSNWWAINSTAQGTWFITEETFI